MHETLKLETPEQLRSAMRLQSMGNQVAILTQKVIELQRAQEREVKVTFGLDAVPIQVTENELVVLVEPEKSLGRPGNSTRLPNGNPGGNGIGSRFTSEEPTQPTEPTSESSD